MLTEGKGYDRVPEQQESTVGVRYDEHGGVWDSRGVGSRDGIEVCTYACMFLLDHDVQ